MFAVALMFFIVNGSFNSIGTRFCVYVAFALTFHCEWAFMVLKKDRRKNRQYSIAFYKKICNFTFFSYYLMHRSAFD